MATVLDQLKQAMQDSGQTRYKIAQGAGISQGQLSRLVSGQRDLTIESAAKLAEYLGLEIIVRPRQRNPRKSATPKATE